MEVTETPHFPTNIIHSSRSRSSVKATRKIKI